MVGARISLSSSDAALTPEEISNMPHTNAFTICGVAGISLHIRAETEKNVTMQVHIFIIDAPERINASVITNDIEVGEEFVRDRGSRTFESFGRIFISAPTKTADKQTER